MALALEPLFILGTKGDKDVLRCLQKEINSSHGNCQTMQKDL